MDTNNPSAPPAETVANAPLSFDEGVENLSTILEDPADTPELQTDEQENASADTEDGEDDFADPDLDVSEDVEAEEDAETDGPQDYDGGRFAADNAKVRLDDGTVISIADLKRNNLFQRDYTKKTQELSEERRSFEAERSQVSEQAQALSALAEQMTALGQRYLPTPPAPPKPNDPVAYINYLREKETYDAAVAEWQGFEAQRQYLTQIEQQKSEQARQMAVVSEMHSLKERDPFFADPKRVRNFFNEAVELGEKYWGLNADQVMGLNSGAALQILREAMLYRKAVERSKDTQKEVQSKPQMGKAGRRADPKGRVVAERRARTEQLRKTGSIEDAVAVLSNLIE